MGAPPEPASLSELAACVTAYADASVASRGFADLPTVFGCDALDEVRAHVPGFDLPTVAPETERAVHGARNVLLAERARHRDRLQDGAQEQGRTDGRSAARRRDRPDDGRPPLLRVKLFGGFRALLGDVPVEGLLERRRKARTLLALLVLDLGHEIPRDRLAESLWPCSMLDTARRNLYTLWTVLRRALTLPDGTCPYLVRIRNGYKLDEALVDSDVRRVDALCRTLMFGSLDAEGWAEVLTELAELCSDDLMPCDRDNDVVERWRDELRTRIVDALVAASTRLADGGDSQAALWCARAALDRDRTREDVYATLMRTQVAVGQRTAALDTYFACRRYLVDELGIDPSATTVALYRGILEEEAPIA